MYAIIARYGETSPWYLKPNLYSRDAAIAEVRKWRGYDMTRTQYKLVPLGAQWGDPDRWEVL